MDCNPLYCFFLDSRLHRQQYSPTTICFKQTILPPSPLLISKYGLMILSHPFLVPVVLECMSHAPNATHPIPCPFLQVQLPPASQLKPLPSSKVSIGVLIICRPANSSQSFSYLNPNRHSQSFHQLPLISCLNPLGMFGPRLLPLQQHHLKLPMGHKFRCSPR